MKNKRKLLLIGWDGADWKVINKLIDAGKMPAMEKLINNGVIGNLATLDPPFSPMLWTTIATGVRPDKHGILGFSEPSPNGQGVQPVSSTSRKVKAIWNILMQEGYKSHVVGWWPSHPAEPINGVMVLKLQLLLPLIVLVQLIHIQMVHMILVLMVNVKVLLVTGMTHLKH